MRVLASALLVVALLNMASPSIADGEADCHWYTCVAEAQSPPSGSLPDSSSNTSTEASVGGATESDSSSSGDGESVQCTTWGGGVVPCSSEAWGVWSNASACYLTAASLTASHPAARGHDLAEERAYWCTVPDPNTDTIERTVELVWVHREDAPAAAPEVVAAEVLAQRAVDQLRFATADARMAPTPPGPTWVSLETWLWVPESQWRTLDASASAGPTTVTVQAAPERVEWDMGAMGATVDSTVVCYGPGRVWVDGMGSHEQTDCGYTYEVISRDQPDGAFSVETTMFYEIMWSCAGACTASGGSLPEMPGPTSMTPLRVQERQSVVISRS